ncbi:YdcF family protein [Sphingomonas sp. 1P06PA]|uniref:YdcF family protein n=1 Tax=Sphingomonas sp. 1P06PA TaxID=554121 RepID=UPI0039A586B4
MIARIAAAAALIYLLGFALFAVTLPGPAGDGATDAIVVVTGGPGRVPRGLALLGQGRAKRMLVSGADRRVRLAELAAEYRVDPALVAARVDLGRESVDTRTNAEETADWVRRGNYRSIRLITNGWHMPRARYEVARMLPAGVTLVPDAVPGEPGLLLLTTEYTKYLLRRLTAPLGL